jgi:flagellar secretion chaperone FliS
MDYAGAHRAYTESSILTAPPERLVVMLYDGAIRFLKQAAVAQRGGQHQMFLDRLRRGEAIIDELNVTLDMSQGGEVAARLRSIYLFCKRHLVEAHLKRDASHIDEVVRLLTDLRESWQQLAVQGAGADRPATAAG